MHVTNSHRWLRAAAAGISCRRRGLASIGAGSRPAEQVVLERAQGALEPLVDRDFAAAYTYLTAGYRAVVPLAAYRRQTTGPAQWEGAKAHSANARPRAASSRSRSPSGSACRPRRPVCSSSFVDETWVLEDGQWFKYEASEPG